jgi:hypothetical protein
LSKPSKTERYSGADSLNDYLDAARDRPFVWGSHDCLHFAVGAMTAQTGQTYVLPSYGCPTSALRAARRTDLLAALDWHFRRCAHVPPPGSLVAVKENGPLGYRLGVVVSDKAAYVSPNGLVFDRLQPDTDLYWTLP